MTSIGYDELTLPYSRHVAEKDAQRLAQARHRAALTACQVSDRHGEEPGCTRVALTFLGAVIGMFRDRAAVLDYINKHPKGPEK